jgi:phage shock protein C
VNTRRLYRSADDRILAGVAGGVAAYFDVDPVIVRIIWFLSVFFTGSLTFWAYLIMIIVVPLEPAEWPPASPWAPGGTPVGTASGFVPSTPGTAPFAGSAPTTGSTDPGTAPAGSPAADATTADPNAANPSAAAPTTPPPGAAPGGGWSSDWRSQRRQDRWQRRAERWQQRADGRGYERGGAGLVFGLLLILVGGMLAWHQIDPSFDISLTWPVLIIALGAILVVSSFRFGGRS